MAIKDGWLKSNELEFHFYKKGIEPVGAKLLSTTSKDYKAKGAATLIDGQLGDPDNFREGTWLGFRENSISVQFYFSKPTPIREFTLLYNKNIGSYLMPPQQVEIWGGDQENNLKLIQRITPAQPLKYEPNAIGAVNLSVKGNYSIIKIIAAPVAKLPAWHTGKGEKGWLMVSEAIFR
jgi:hypothetical protein